MRKEVKLGFAIGGIVLAVVTVWVLSIGGSEKPKPDAAAPGASGAQSLAARPTTPATNPSNAADAPAPVFPGPTAAVDPAAPSADLRPIAEPGPDGAVSATASKTTTDLDWGKLLNGDQPMLMTQAPAGPVLPAPTAPGPAVTPEPIAPAAPSPISPAPEATADPAVAPSPAAPSAPEGVAGAPPEALPPSNTQVASLNPSPSAPAAPVPFDLGPTPQSDIVPTHQVAPPLPATRPSENVAPSGRSTGTAAGGSRTHIVQRGETLSSIAAAAYGSPNYYPHILRANSGLNPNRMKPGMTIILPDLPEPRSQDLPGGSSGSAAHDPAARRSLDPGREYRVEPGESLYKISLKLYGKAEMSDTLYQANKEQIGADPARVKAGMVLKLPSPPSTTR